MSVAAFASGFGGLVYRPVEASAETGDIRGPNFPHIASPMRAAGGASGPLQGIGAAAFEVRHMGFTKDHVISRRDMVIGGAGGAAVVALASLSDTALAQVASLGKFEMVKSDEEWRHELSSEQYAVLRRHQT